MSPGAFKKPTDKNKLQLTETAYSRAGRESAVLKQKRICTGLSKCEAVSVITSGKIVLAMRMIYQKKLWNDITSSNELRIV